MIGTVAIEAVSFWLANSYQDIWPIISAYVAAGYPVSSCRLISLILSERERVGSFGRPPGKGDHGSS